MKLIRHSLTAKGAGLVLLALGLLQPNVCALQPINVSAAQTTGGTFRLTFNGQIVDNGTGRTSAVSSSKPKEIVVVGI